MTPIYGVPDVLRGRTRQIRMEESAGAPGFSAPVPPGVLPPSGLAVPFAGNRFSLLPRRLEVAENIDIPAIGISARILQVKRGDGAREMLKGVAQYHGAEVGKQGNILLVAHNDGPTPDLQLFKDLDKLRPGDEIVLQSRHASYTYAIAFSQVVATDATILPPMNRPSVMLLSCWPFGVDALRVVVIGTLKK